MKVGARITIWGLHFPALLSNNKFIKSFISFYSWIIDAKAIFDTKTFKRSFRHNPALILFIDFHLASLWEGSCVPKNNIYSLQ